MKDEHTLSRRLRHLDQMQRLRSHPIHAYRMGDLLLVAAVIFVLAICLANTF